MYFVMMLGKLIDYLMDFTQLVITEVSSLDIIKIKVFTKPLINNVDGKVAFQIFFSNLFAHTITNLIHIIYIYIDIHTQRVRTITVQIDRENKTALGKLGLGPRIEGGLQKQRTFALERSLLHNLLHIVEYTSN
ncbi:hypothetical protein ACJX0J_019257 [Zea mays]